MAKSTENSNDGKSELGLNKHIYALGNSFKDGLIWGLAATGAALALFAFGKKDGNFIDKASGLLNRGHAWIKNKFANGITFIGEKVFNAENAGKIFRVEDPTKTSGSAEITAAVLAGSIIGHVVQVPSFVKGLRTADRSIKKYDKMSGERDALVAANAQLVEENVGYKKTLAEKSGTFTEMVDKPAAEVGAVR